MDYAQWLLSDGVYKPIDELDIDIGNDNELLSLYWREEAYTNVWLTKDEENVAWTDVIEGR